jgi:rod shape-determining protein MreD
MVYLLYILLHCAAIILQLTIIPLFAVRETIPDLILIVVIAGTLKHGRVFGILSGFAAGLLYDSFGTGLLGLSSLAYSAAAYIVGVLANEQLERRVTTILSVFVAAMLCHGILYHTILLLGTNIGFWTTFISYTIPGTVYTLLFVAIIHLLIPRLLWGARLPK